jgi:hypothetical protein
MPNKDPYSDLGDRPLKAFAKEILRQELVGLVFGSVLVLVAISTLVVLITFFSSISQFWFGSIILCSLVVGSVLGFLLIQSIQSNQKGKLPPSA